MTQHKGARATLIMLELGILAILAIYAFEFLNSLAAVALCAAGLIVVFYYSLKIWRSIR